ncbi:MAG TPA: hypothetical protein VIH27_01735 [Nitrososphaerales archaeon]
MSNLQKSGILGIVVTLLGIALLLIVFTISYQIFNTYYPFKTDQVSDIQATLTLVLGSAIQVMFLGVMGWVGSILLLRGVDFMKVDRGVGVVTFKVDKGVGVYTAIEDKKE